MQRYVEPKHYEYLKNIAHNVYKQYKKDTTTKQGRRMNLYTSKNDRINITYDKYNIGLGVSLFTCEDFWMLDFMLLFWHIYLTNDK